MKKITTTLSAILAFTCLLMSCKKDYEKNSTRLLLESNEKECSELIDNLFEELNKNDYYKWNGEKCELTFEGELESVMNSIIDFHKQNHNFVNKNDEFDEEKWSDWMHFYDHPEESENHNELFTNCFICLIKNQLEDKANFDTKLSDFTKQSLIYSAYFGSNVQEKEKKLTKIKEAEIAEEKIVEAMYKPVSYRFENLPPSIKVSKKRSGNNLYVYASGAGVNVTALYKCSKSGSGYTASLYSVSVESNGITQTQTLNEYDLWDIPRMYGVLAGVLNSLSELCKNEP